MEDMTRVVKMVRSGSKPTQISRELKISYWEARKLYQKACVNIGDMPKVSVNITSPVFKSAILKLLKRPITLQRLAEVLDIDAKTVETSLDDLEACGYIVNYVGGTVQLGTSIDNSTIPKITVANHFDGKPVTFGFVTDTHLCSRSARLDVLEVAYDTFAKRGITHVFHAGNMVDGECRFNAHELLAHGITDQAMYVLDHYPQRKGMKTYFVDGDDHEGWWCFESGVEILTKRGWVDFSELNNQDIVATKTASGVFEWQKPTKLIVKHHKGTMIRLKHRSIDIAVTPEHRFEIALKTSMHAASTTTIMTAQEIYDNFKPRCIGIPRTTNMWTGVNPGIVDIPIQPILPHTDTTRIWHPRKVVAHALAVLCGWYATEGYVDKNLVSICQYETVNQENRQLIIECIKAIGGRPLIYPDRICVSSKDLAVWLLTNCGSGWENKRLPDWVLDMPQSTLVEVFDAMIRGDGHDRGENNGWKFYSGSQRLLANMAEICQKIGLTTSSTQGKGCINLHVGEIHKTAFLFEQPSLEEYDGEVFCVSVPNERIFVRKNGKTLWSMNCQREGIQFGRYLEMEAHDHGRNDLVYIGYLESDFILRSKRGQATVKVMHPGGGSAYAFSYSPQRIVESLQGGEKPAVLLIGHFHKMEYCYPRSVHVVQGGTTQDQTRFMRKKKLEAHVGFVIITLEQDVCGGVTRFQPEFFPFFDRGYIIKRDVEGMKK